MIPNPPAGPKGRGAILVVAVALVAASPLLGQRQSPSTVQLAAMQRFDAWVGTWTGSGWSMDAAGKRTDFNLVESVARKVGGTVLLLEGRGTAKGDSTITTHDGLVLLYYDEHAGRYRWNGHELASGTIDAEPQLVDRGLQWSIKANEGRATVRFTIEFDETRWHEVGEVSVDGVTWGKFMEVNLGRVGRIP